VTVSALPHDRFQQPARSRYRPEIDGMRAVAVIAVIVNHFNKELLPSGFLGVDIFFVISGYVITSSLFGHRSETLPRFLLGFYGRRVKRLVPALIACVLLTSIMMGMVNPNNGLSLQTGIAALFGVSNIFLYSLSVDYFAPLTELNPFTHTWSLGVEEQFYLIFPLLFWFSGISQKRHHSRKVLAIVIGMLSLASLVGFIFNSVSSPSAAYFLMPWRFWEMGAGVLLYILLDALRFYRYSFYGLLPVGLVVALLCLFAFPSTQRALTTPVTVCLSSLLIATIRPAQPMHKVLAWRPIVSIGLISYSLYLWHWSVLVVSRYTTGIHPWTIPFQVGIILILGLASYLLIENPLRRSPWRGSDLANIGMGLASLTSASAVLAAMGVLPGFSLYTGNRKSPILAGQPGLASPYRVKGVPGAGWQGTPCLLTSNADVGKVIDPSDCQLGDASNAAGQILVLGDSFAPSFTTSFDDIVRQDRRQVTLIASYGASPVVEVVNDGNYQGSNKYFWSQVVPRQLSLLRPGDAVFLINDLAHFSPARRDSLAELKLSQYRQGLLRLSDQLAAKGVKLYVLANLPFAREADCAPEVARREWFNAFGGPCHFLSKNKTLPRSKSLRDMLLDLAQQGKITLVDLMPAFCPDDICTYTNFRQNVVLYRDSNSHPSIEGARLGAKIFREKLISPGT
jgi:peptidoglycan/LPS O-acetylase OafA/YrhL